MVYRFYPLPYGSKNPVFDPKKPGFLHPETRFFDLYHKG